MSADDAEVLRAGADVLTGTIIAFDRPVRAVPQDQLPALLRNRQLDDFRRIQSLKAAIRARRA
jgi:hypothetical protein